MSTISRVMMILACAAAFACGALFGAVAENAHGSAVIHESSIAVAQPGPHEGGGETTAYPFFDTAPGLKLVFRKRELHPGAAIGAHLHDKDEIYYVISGAGDYTLDGNTHRVGPGNAMLTRPGSTHSLRQVGSADLVVLVSYIKPADPPAPPVP